MRAPLLVHVWDSIKDLKSYYSLLGLSTHKHLKGYPTMTLFKGFKDLWGVATWGLASDRYCGAPIGNMAQ